MRGADLTNVFFYDYDEGKENAKQGSNALP